MALPLPHRIGTSHSSACIIIFHSAIPTTCPHLLSRRDKCKSDKGIFIEFTETYYRAGWITVGGFSELGSQPSGHYLCDLGPSQDNRKIQVAEKQLSLCPLTPILGPFLAFKRG